MIYQEACQILRVPPGASAADIKSAYRRLVREYHPDRNPDDPQAPEIFRQVHEAYKLLDGGAGSSSNGVPVAGLTDRLARAVPRRGPDVRGELRLTLQEVLTGTKTDITFVDQQGCERCGSSGGEPGSYMITCPVCPEQGSCRWCDDTGEIPDEACSACRGQGVIGVDRSVRVSVPRSARDGEEKIVAGKGKWGIETRGDLRLRIRVEPVTGMTRIEHDLEVEVPIGVPEAVLGGYAQVPTLEGGVHTIAVTPGSSSGKRYRLSGQGFYRSDQGEDRGDLYAVISIRVPIHLTERERYLYQLLLEEEHKRIRAELEA